jgi:hypothetical protein
MTHGAILVSADGSVKAAVLAAIVNEIGVKIKIREVRTR